MNNEFEFLIRILIDAVEEETRQKFFLCGYNALEKELVMKTNSSKLTDVQENGNSSKLQRAHTMIGAKRLRNILYCLKKIIEDGVGGDLLEAGAWRGGATIFMQAVLKRHKVKDKNIYVADSFEGLPPPDKNYIADRGSKFYLKKHLSVSLEEVKNSFKQYGMLDDNVKFIKGWFKDTMKLVPTKKLSLLRLDGDMYGSTWEVLSALYNKVQPGGFVVVDDYAIKPCRMAIDKFRKANNIREKLEKIDYTGVFWRKS